MTATTTDLHVDDTFRFNPAPMAVIRPSGILAFVGMTPGVEIEALIDQIAPGLDKIERFVSPYGGEHIALFGEGSDDIAHIPNDLANTIVGEMLGVETTTLRGPIMITGFAPDQNRYIFAPIGRPQGLGRDVVRDIVAIATGQGIGIIHTTMDA